MLERNRATRGGHAPPLAKPRLGYWVVVTTPTAKLSEIERSNVWAGGLRWNVARCGDRRGRAVVLLHGFPEHWRSWQRQLTELAAAGFDVFAPDLPGFGETAEPAGYDLETLADVTAAMLGEVTGNRRAHVVGHDWGGMVAQATAALHPSSVAAIVAACAPHPATWTDAARDPMQVLRSSYVGVFQIPMIERLLGANRGTVAHALFRGAVSAMDSADALRRGLEYYRANLRPWRIAGADVGRISQPGLVIHAQRDPAIGKPIMERTAELYDDLRGFHEIDSGHFVQRERAAEFNRLVQDFLSNI